MKKVLIWILIGLTSVFLSVLIGNANEMDSCYQKPSTCTLKQLCKRAMFGDIYDISHSKKKYTLEAKERFLTPAWCKEKKEELSCTAEYMGQCSDLEICTKATYTESGTVFWWSSINLRVSWFEEAKQRGLICGTS
jgi:hypothetical protein